VLCDAVYIGRLNKCNLRCAIFVVFRRCYRVMPLWTVRQFNVKTVRCFETSGATSSESVLHKPEERNPRNVWQLLYCQERGIGVSETSALSSHNLY
jgi:hypothetical protein